MNNKCKTYTVGQHQRQVVHRVSGGIRRGTDFSHREWTYMIVKATVTEYINWTSCKYYTDVTQGGLSDTLSLTNERYTVLYKLFSLPEQWLLKYIILQYFSTALHALRNFISELVEPPHKMDGDWSRNTVRFIRRHSNSSEERELRPNFLTSSFPLFLKLTKLFTWLTQHSRGVLLLTVALFWCWGACQLLYAFVSFSFRSIWTYTLWEYSSSLELLGVFGVLGWIRSSLTQVARHKMDWYIRPLINGASSITNVIRTIQILLSTKQVSKSQFTPI